MAGVGRMGSHPGLSCQGVSAERPQRLWAVVQVWWFLGTCKGLAECVIPADNFRSWRSVCVLWNSEPFPTCCSWMHTVPQSLLVQWVRAWMPPAPPAFPCLGSVQSKPVEGGREGAAAFTNLILLIGLAGLSIPCVTALPCPAGLVSDQHSSTLQKQTKTPTEMREKIWPLLLANFRVSCWQVF